MTLKNPLKIDDFVPENFGIYLDKNAEVTKYQIFRLNITRGYVNGIFMFGDDLFAIYLPDTSFHVRLITRIGSFSNGCLCLSDTQDKFISLDGMFEFKIVESITTFKEFRERIYARIVIEELHK